MWLLVLCCAFLFIVKFMLDKRRDEKKFPPGPPGLPIIGNFLDLKRMVKETKFYCRTWLKLADMYGSVVGLRMGLSNPLIIVSGREGVTKMLSRREFDGRPDGFLVRHRTLGERRGIVFTDGQVWIDQRRFLLKSLKDVGFGKRAMEAMILEDGIALTKVIEKEAKKGVIDNFCDLTGTAVLNTLWRLTAGFRFELDNDDPKFDEMIQLTKECIRENSVACDGLLHHFPLLRFILPGYLGFTAHNNRIMRMWSYFREEVMKHKMTRKKGEERDLIDLYLEEVELRERDPSSTFDEAQLIALLKDLFAAGLETTSNSIGFVIAYLVSRQDVQKKLHAEIDKVLGKNDWPTTEMRNKLPYLNATLTEVSRMANVGPTSIPHRAMEDTTFMGYEIKKGYIMLANLMSVHMDRDHWGDPENFRPERFIDEKGQFFEDSWMMAFGSGRRRCIGENLAKLNLFTIIACLIKKFHFELSPGSPKPNLFGRDGFTIAPPEFSLIVKPRY